MSTTIGVKQYKYTRIIIYHKASYNPILRKTGIYMYATSADSDLVR